jgi:hypothetical protein
MMEWCRVKEASGCRRVELEPRFDARRNGTRRAGGWAAELARRERATCCVRVLRYCFASMDTFDVTRCVGMTLFLVDAAV